VSERPAREQVALMIAATVCAVILGTGLALGVIAVADPSVQTGEAARTWAHAVGILFGLTVGYLLGRKP
jgi:hypothetical protein